MKVHSIRRQLAWLTIPPLLVLAVCLEVYFLHDRFRAMDENLLERGKLISSQIAVSAEYGIFSNNTTFLQKLASDALQQLEVKGVIILNGSLGTLIGAGEFSGVPKKSIVNIRETSRVGEPLRLSVFKGVMEKVNSHQPVHLDLDGLRIFHPIIAAQVELGEFNAEQNVSQVGAVIVEMSLANTLQVKARMLWGTILGSIFFLVFPISLIYLGGRSIVIPIQALRDAVQALGEGDLKARAPTSQTLIELVTLASSINEMAENLQLNRQTLEYRADAANRIVQVIFESHEGMIIADAGREILWINNAMLAMIGFSQDEAEGMALHQLYSDHNDAQFVAEMWHAVHEHGGWQGEIRMCRKDGNTFPALLNITAVKEANLIATDYIVTCTDNTQRKLDEEEI
jgi:PAS domain S-box-containing protein